MDPSRPGPRHRRLRLVGHGAGRAAARRGRSRRGQRGLPAPADVRRRRHPRSVAARHRSPPSPPGCRPGRSSTPSRARWSTAGPPPLGSMARPGWPGWSAGRCCPGAPSGGPRVTRVSTTPGACAPAVRGVFIANLVAQTAILVTGAVVRLTGSGLGCPTWPECVDGSYTPTARQPEAWHKYVEFGNRLLTFVLVILAIAAVVAAVWDRRAPPIRRPAEPHAHPAAVARPDPGHRRPGPPRRRDRAHRPQPGHRLGPLPAVHGHRRRRRRPRRAVGRPGRPARHVPRARARARPGVGPGRRQRPRRPPRARSSPAADRTAATPSPRTASRSTRARSRGCTPTWSCCSSG